MRSGPPSRQARVRLIVNADDFGMAPAITDAIIDCHRRGIVTSTSLMANLPAAEHAARRAQEVPGLGVGIHLNLTQGPPLSPPERIPMLVGTDGEFLPKSEQLRRLRSGGSVAEQVRSELSAQVRRALTLGICPTHCDSHHGVHRMASVRGVMVEVMRTFGIPCARTQLEWHRPVRRASLQERLRCRAHNLSMLLPVAQQYASRFLLRRAGLRTADRKVTLGMIYPHAHDPKDQLLACLANLPPGVNELVLHPGYEVPGWKSASAFARVRVVETKLAMDADVIAAVETNAISLISYREL